MPQLEEPHETPVVDVADVEADLVHVGRDEHPLGVRLGALVKGDQVAERVGLEAVHRPGEFALDEGPHPLLAPGDPRDGGELLKQFHRGLHPRRCCRC